MINLGIWEELMDRCAVVPPPCPDSKSSDYDWNWVGTQLSVVCLYGRSWVP